MYILLDACQHPGILRIIYFGKLLIDLVKQLYSDLEIVNLTNPNRNDALKEFFKKRIIGEDD